MSIGYFYNSAFQHLESMPIRLSVLLHTCATRQTTLGLVIINPFRDHVYRTLATVKVMTLRDHAYMTKLTESISFWNLQAVLKSVDLF